ncbi:MAG: precorrin-6A/cobalt-precorrin-6A reductase, partial [Rhodobacteraceae bacterium]|nr:precorrin-6A/cobalt-precorrin-6A reductase [Paracoccaceae bacterium]
MKALLLAGTSEAQAIAASLAGEGRVELIASLAGVTRNPAPFACETRLGGFGGPEGFRQYLAAEGINAVIDATHPFAARMSATAADITAREGIPHLQVLRPEWVAGPGDDWTDLARPEDAAAHIAPGGTVFLATG